MSDDRAVIGVTTTGESWPPGGMMSTFVDPQAWDGALFDSAPTVNWVGNGYYQDNQLTLNADGLSPAVIRVGEDVFSQSPSAEGFGANALAVPNAPGLLVSVDNARPLSAGPVLGLTLAWVWGAIAFWALALWEGLRRAVLRRGLFGPRTLAVQAGVADTHPGNALPGAVLEGLTSSISLLAASVGRSLRPVAPLANNV
jgi:hypothetical protein